MKKLINYIVINRKTNQPFFDYLSIVYCFLLCGLQIVIVSEIFDYISYSILIVLGFINLFRSHLNTKKVLCYFLLMAIGSVSFIYTKNITLIKIAAMGMALSNCSLRNILKYGYYTQIIFFIFIVFLSFFGFNSQYSLLPIDSSRKIRYSLGFVHPNTGASYFLYTIFLYYFYKRKATLKDSVFFLLMVSIIYYLTDSRTTFFITIIFFFLLFLSNIFNIKKSFQYFLTGFTFIFFTFISLFVSSFIYSDFLNSLLSGRLELSKEIMTNYSLKLITTETIDIIIDNVYINLLYKQGLLVYLIIASIYIVSLIVFIKNNNRKESCIVTIIFISLCISGFAETYLINPNLIIPFFLYLFQFLEQSKKRKIIYYQFS